MDYIMRRTALSVICFLVYCLFSCKEGRRLILTPREFINHTTINRADYVKDSMLITSQLRVDLLKEKDFFSNSSYFESTEIMVDTIIYYADLKKMAALIMVKNPCYRNLYPDNKKYNYYYDGTCYIGKKIDDSLCLSWMGPSFSNSENKEKLSGILKDYFFNEFASYDTTTHGACKYNLNDVRFKDCKCWSDGYYFDK